MLNLVMTHSARLAAVTNNKRLGDDVMRDRALLHRLEWLRRVRTTDTSAKQPATDGALRERTA